MHKAQLILDELAARLNGLVLTLDVKEIIRGGNIRAEQYPAISLLMGEDNEVTETSVFMTSVMTAHTDIYINTTKTDTDIEVLKVRAAIHKILLTQGYDLGLDFVLYIKFAGMREPEPRGENNTTNSCLTRLTWSIQYRTNKSDPTL